MCGACRHASLFLIHIVALIGVSFASLELLAFLRLCIVLGIPLSLARAVSPSVNIGQFSVFTGVPNSACSILGVGLEPATFVFGLTRDSVRNHLTEVFSAPDGNRIVDVRGRVSLGHDHMREAVVESRIICLIESATGRGFRFLGAGGILYLAELIFFWPRAIQTNGLATQNADAAMLNRSAFTLVFTLSLRVSVDVGQEMVRWWVAPRTVFQICHVRGLVVLKHLRKCVFAPVSIFGLGR